VAFHKILVPYDSSKASGKALSNALEMARMTEASERLYKQDRVTITIILLHVLPEIPTPLNFGGTPLRILSDKTGERITFREYLKEVYQEMKGTAINMLEQKKKENPINIANVSIEPRVTIGLPADEIVEMAIEENAELIIMGTTGLTGVSKIKALGSVTRNVSERAKCPVLLVR
jgi:nucleotide-binding universal stress UspA family protein